MGTSLVDHCLAVGKRQYYKDRIQLLPSSRFHIGSPLKPEKFNKSILYACFIPFKNEEVQAKSPSKTMACNLFCHHIHHIENLAAHTPWYRQHSVSVIFYEDMWESSRCQQTYNGGGRYESKKNHKFASNGIHLRHGLGCRCQSCRICR